MEVSHRERVLAHQDLDPALQRVVSRKAPKQVDGFGNRLLGKVLGF